jgi:hypothetical protein
MELLVGEPGSIPPYLFFSYFLDIWANSGDLGYGLAQFVTISVPHSMTFHRVPSLKSGPNWPSRRSVMKC